MQRTDTGSFFRWALNDLFDKHSVLLKEDSAQYAKLVSMCKDWAEIMKTENIVVSGWGDAETWKDTKRDKVVEGFFGFVDNTCTYSRVEGQPWLAFERSLYGHAESKSREQENRSRRRNRMAF